MTVHRQSETAHADLTADAESCTLEVDGSLTWAKVEALAAPHRMTLGGLVDTCATETVAEAFARPQWLPALWPAHTLRAACLSVHAETTAGAVYRSVSAPRTSSGPDLRAVFVGTGGAAGHIVRAQFQAEPVGEVVWFRRDFGTDRTGVREILDRFAGHVTFHGDGEALFARVRSTGSVAALAVRALGALGFVDTDTPLPRRVAPPAVLTVPWDLVPPTLDGAETGVALSLLCAGPTHVALAVVGGDSADVWARGFAERGGAVVRWSRRTAQDELARIPGIGHG